MRFWRKIGKSLLMILPIFRGGLTETNKHISSPIEQDDNGLIACQKHKEKLQKPGEQQIAFSAHFMELSNRQTLVLCLSKPLLTGKKRIKRDGICERESYYCFENVAI